MPFYLIHNVISQGQQKPKTRGIGKRIEQVSGWIGDTQIIDNIPVKKGNLDAALNKAIKETIEQIERDNPQTLRSSVIEEQGLSKTIATKQPEKLSLKQRMERGLPVRSEELVDPYRRSLTERLYDINIDELQTSEELDEYFKGNPKGAREFKNQIRQLKQMARRAFSINPNGSINSATGNRSARNLNNTDLNTRDGFKGTFTRLNFYQHWLGSSQQIAIANPMIRPFFEAIREYSYIMRKTQSTFNDFYRAKGALIISLYASGESFHCSALCSAVSSIALSSIR